MVARPVHRWGVAEGVAHGLRPGGLAGGGVAFHGLISDPDAARAVRDASLLLPPLAGIDLGDCRPGGAPVAALVREGFCPVQVGGDDAGAMAFAASASTEGAAALVLLSGRLPIPPAGAAGLLAIGTHGLVGRRDHDGWRAAGGGIVPARAGAERLGQALAALPGTRAVVVVDLGVVDTGYAAGTDGLNVGGMTPMELFAAVDRVAARVRPVAIALCNLAPHRDPRGHSERIAAEVLGRLAAVP